jgi:hypothetical protein
MMKVDEKNIFILLNIFLFRKQVLYWDCIFMLLELIPDILMQIHALSNHVTEGQAIC